jgi:alkanesulfonate monooxygenase SsuD/methylene tetrahydromethanopterin reductase-like flavin-dependent oxidoreductase (luciferase family)
VSDTHRVKVSARGVTKAFPAPAGGEGTAIVALRGAGAFAHRDEHFDIAGRFNVPRSPQGRPVIPQAGESDAGREFAAAAGAIFSRHGTLEAGGIVVPLLQERGVFRTGYAGTTLRDRLGLDAPSTAASRAA